MTLKNLLFSLGVASFTLSLPTLGLASDDDTRWLLYNSNRNIEQYRQSTFLDTFKPQPMQIVINGQVYEVGHSKDELELAIYYAINFGQWDKAEEFIGRYRLFDSYQKKIVLMVEGLIARAKGEYSLALEKLESANKVDEKDLRIKLELARVYTEDNQNKEAIKLFKEISVDQIPEGTKEVVKGYIENVEKRNDWHGSLGLNFAYNNNNNKGNGKSYFSGYIGSTGEVWTRLPEPTRAASAGYNVVLSKKFAIAGNHNIMLRPMSYGTLFQREKKVSQGPKDLKENTSILHLGYNYLSAKNNFNVLGSFENYYNKEHTEHQAWGVSSSWDYFINNKWQVNLQAGVKRIEYKGEKRKLFADYNQRNFGLGASYYLSNQSSISMGVDIYRKKFPSKAYSNYEYVARAGFFKMFDNQTYINSLMLYRNVYNDGKHYMFGKRKDRQRQFIASVGNTKFNIKGVYPEISFRRVINKNNSIYYGYKQSEITLSLRKNF